MDAPERIWANICVVADFKALCGEWNYCDVGNPNDTEYIRADLYQAANARADEWRSAYHKTHDLFLDVNARADAAEAALKTARDERDVLRDALYLYGDRSKMGKTLVRSLELHGEALANDAGDRAKDILALIQEPRA